jgi:hypothetical protein
MKHDGTVTITSLVTILLVTLHVAGDIVRGMAPGNLTSLGLLSVIVVLWLYGTLLLPGRRGGSIILLLGSLFGLVVPILHMKGAGVDAGAAPTDGEFFFIWILLALGASSGFLLVLAVRSLWGSRRTGPVSHQRDGAA